MDLFVAQLQRALSTGFGSQLQRKVWPEAREWQHAFFVREHSQAGSCHQHEARVTSLEFRICL